jgi:hypothetical protein
MARRKRQDIADASATMQIDAIADQLEDYEAQDELGAAPPPLPPPRRSNAVWLVGGLVVLLAAGLGIAAGVLFSGDSSTPTPPPAAVGRAAPEPSAPVAEDRPTSPEPTPEQAPPEGAEPAGSEPAEAPAVLQMDDIVFGDTP